MNFAKIIENISKIYKLEKFLNKLLKIYELFLFIPKTYQIIINLVKFWGGRACPLLRPFSRTVYKRFSLNLTKLIIMIKTSLIAFR